MTSTDDYREDSTRFSTWKLERVLEAWDHETDAFVFCAALWMDGKEYFAVKTTDHQRSKDINGLRSQAIHIPRSCFRDKAPDDLTRAQAPDSEDSYIERYAPPNAGDIDITT